MHTHKTTHKQLLGIFKHKLQEYGLQVEVFTDKNHIHITDKKTLARIYYKILNCNVCIDTE